LEDLRRRIDQIKKRRPAYGPILDFYQKIREKQEEAKASLKVNPVAVSKEWKDLFAKEGFPLFQREDFPIDGESSSTLFRSICEIAKESNPLLSQQVEKIEEILGSKKLDLKKLFRKGIREQRIEQVAEEFALDKKVFLFLFQESVRPSIETAVPRLHEELPPGTQPKGTCPLCGGLPSMSLLKEETGKRFLFCPHCGCQWQVDRIACPYCTNREHETLHYLYAEDEENYRIDLCEKCHQYIKTIDLRKTDVMDPFLEDIATLHLDVLAAQKGFKRPSPNPWTS